MSGYGSGVGTGQRRTRGRASGNYSNSQYLKYARPALCYIAVLLGMCQKSFESVGPALGSEELRARLQNLPN